MKGLGRGGLSWRAPVLVATVLSTCLALAGACGGEVARGDLPIRDDFSGTCSWSEDNDEHISLGCEAGEYRALFKRTDERLHHVIPKRLDEPVESAAVEADASLHAFPEGSSDDFQGHGVGCLASEVGAPTQGYLFLVAPSSAAIAIIKVDETDEELREQFYFRALVDEGSEAVAGVGKANRIRGDCQYSADAVELTMYLDGEEVAHATDRNGFGPFEAFGFMVISSKVDTDIRFDNFEARELG